MVANQATADNQKLRCSSKHTDSSTNRALRVAMAEATRYTSSLDEACVTHTDTHAQLKAKLHVPLRNEGLPAEEVIQQLIHGAQGGLLKAGSGRFFAWVMGGTLPSALAADLLTATWDQNAALYSSAPAASVIEEAAGAWMLELLDLPREASYAFTTGCQLAHFTCLAAARQAVLKAAGWNVTEDGLFGSPRIRILTSDHRHSSVDRAVRYLGIGLKSIEVLASNDNGQVLPEALLEALDRCTMPTILVLKAADLNVAGFDLYSELIPIAKAAGVWVHVDGAFGLFARASRSKRDLTTGIDQADSWATDLHKWMNVPFDCGMAIVRDRTAHREAMSINACYLTHAESEERDQIDWGPDWSRRARGITVYAALRELGKDGVEALVDRCCGHCLRMVTEIGKLHGAEVLHTPTLNQGLVRFLDTREGATSVDHDRRTDTVIAAINKSGEAFFSPTLWNGMKVMRISVVNWRTSDNDVRRTVIAIHEALNVPLH